MVLDCIRPRSPCISRGRAHCRTSIGLRIPHSGLPPSFMSAAGAAWIQGLRYLYPGPTVNHGVCHGTGLPLQYGGLSCPAWSSITTPPE